MTPRPRKEPLPVTLESLPYKLRMSVVKLMADSYIDLELALEKAAVLIDMNSKGFKKAVSKEAQKQHKSRFMKEMNNARSTIQRNANAQIREQRQESYDAGYLQGQQDSAIYFYCKICGKMIYVQPGSDAHQAVINLMHEYGWVHKQCHDQIK